MKFEPVLDNLIVKPVEEPKKAGNVILPDTAIEKPCRGYVVAVGTRQGLDIDKPMDLKEGDLVLFAKNAGETIEDENGESFKVIQYKYVYTKLI